jgi:predicted RNA-binding protein associated with RNAse of E/G family
MCVKLESRANHLAIEGATDSIGLLENIRTVMFQFQSQRYAPLALHEAKRHFYLFLQDRHATCQQYHEIFKNNVDVIEYCGGMVSNDTGLMDNQLTSSGLDHATATPGELEDAQDVARDI